MQSDPSTRTIYDKRRPQRVWIVGLKDFEHIKKPLNRCASKIQINKL